VSGDVAVSPFAPREGGLFSHGRSVLSRSEGRHWCAELEDSVDYGDRHVALAAQHVDADVVLVADQQEIDGRIGHLQVVNA